MAIRNFIVKVVHQLLIIARNKCVISNGNVSVQEESCSIRCYWKASGTIFNGKFRRRQCMMVIFG